MSIGIRHIEVWVSDLERSLAFYDGLFPLIGWRRVDENGYACGETKLYFLQRSVERQDSIGPRHVCFHAERRSIVDDVAAYIRTTGCELIRGPMVGPDSRNGTYTVDFRDPDGYVLEVKHTPLRP